MKYCKLFGKSIQNIGIIACVHILYFIFRKLLSQLEQYKASIHEKPESEAASDTSGIVYQFNYRPEQARLAQTTRVADLESRLHRLESVLGTSSDKLSRLTAATSKGKF